MNESQPDPPAHRFFHAIARRLVELARLEPGATVLTLGVSPNALTPYAAATVGPIGKVITLDLVTMGGMQMDLYQADPTRLSFAAATFDSILCPSVIILLPDLPAALNEWRRLLKPGGKVAFSGFGSQAMQPLLHLFATALQRYGVALPASIRPFAWQQLTELEQYYELLRNAGFSAIDVRGEQLGHYLADSAEWWDIVWQSGLRGLLAQLAPGALAQFKAEHLADVTRLATVHGIWLNVAAIFAVGQKQ